MPIPDMEQILGYFGIDVQKLTEVPLHKYKWNNFRKNQNPRNNLHRGDESEIYTSPSISQRIKEMVRGARRRDQAVLNTAFK